MDLKYANVFYGNGETDRFIKEGLASKWFYIKALCGNTTPHAVLPFGKISVGAYSGGYPTGYGTHYPNSCGGIKKLDDTHKIRGFSHLHQSGTGAIQFYYNYAIVTPFYGDMAEIYNFHPLDRESAVPGYYEAEFNNVICKFTVTQNTAIHNYKFKNNGGRLAVDFSNDGLHKIFDEHFRGKVEMKSFEVTDNDIVCFEGVFSGIKLYFATEVKESKAILDDDKMVAIFDFEGYEAELRLSYSTVSMKAAIENIRNSDKTFEETALDASETWKMHLSAIEIETDDEELKEKFYSNFYHTIVKPVDMTGESILGVTGDCISDLATFWDQYKTQLPLVMLTFPEMGKKVANCIVNISRTFNKLPCSFGMSDIFPCEEQGKMFGIFILLDAYYAGLIKKEVIDECIERELASEDYDEFKKSGTFPRYTHIIDVTDACLNVANITDNKELKECLLSLAQNWKNAYDSDGLMSEKSPYYEGDRYTYSFRLQSNMQDRIDIAGGRNRFIKLLDDFFGYNGESVEQITELDAYKKIDSKHYHRFEGFNNECDMETPYAYIFAGRHDRLCEIVHASVNDSFGLGKGGLPGNNDSGGLSSCFMWNVLGIFPHSGVGEFLLGCPHVKKAKIKLAEGKFLEIEAHNLTSDNFYVNKVTFNGEEIKDFRIKTEKILNGGKLEFFMKKNKTIVFLGSSVTNGSENNWSMCEFVRESREYDVVKWALSGTTLADINEKSYVSRLNQEIDAQEVCDCFICQLSTNDASKNLPLGTISESSDKNDFDTQTIIGAIEYIVAKVREKWDCPIMFYTGTFMDSELYQSMVDSLIEISEKWNFEIIDLWNDSEMRAINADDYKAYMLDAVHPSKLGYEKWWGPKFVQSIDYVLYIK